ncbi:MULTISPECIES: hypothetical protein [unclassified Streptomyces]|uniref:hypothetical protein n=1 Tax=unclassified Streptomyces TaxID=2593676 RepID=UPI0003A61ECE|nr:MULTISPECIES: hypothetical protein [unclassified Streptomyces]
MNTAMNYLTVLVVFLLLAAPSLYGIAHDRRIDRQIKKARRDEEHPSHRARFETAA